MEMNDEDQVMAYPAEGRVGGVVSGVFSHEDADGHASCGR